MGGQRFVRLRTLGRQREKNMRTRIPAIRTNHIARKTIMSTLIIPIESGTTENAGPAHQKPQRASNTQSVIDATTATPPRTSPTLPSNRSSRTRTVPPSMPGIRKPVKGK
eukprot:10562923-Heterocapsa_arctica.AAC.1